MSDGKEKTIQNERIASLSPEKQALLARRLQQKRSLQTADVPVIKSRSNKNDYPLSHAQQRMWFLSQWEPESPFYNIASIVQIEGDLNISALERSFNEIIRRHEVLQARFTTSNGQPVQLIDNEMQIELPVFDLTNLSTDEREQQYKILANQEARQPFDLRSGKLVRASLVKLEVKKYILFLTFHHMVADGWSIGLFIREAAILYDAYSQGKPSPLNNLTLQYADYAEWQQEWLKGDQLKEQLAFWKGQLAGEDVFLELPTDHPRPNVQTFNGAYYKFSIPVDLSLKLKELALQEGVTLFMFLLAAFEVLLHRYSGQEDIRIGSPIANRKIAELEGLIGLFVNTLVMRGDFSGDPTFLEFLKRIRAMALGAYAHQDLPLESLLDELNVVRDLSRTPLYQVMFTLQESPLQSLDLPAARLTILEPESGTAKFDLTLFMEDHSALTGITGNGNTQAGLVGAVEYNTDLFSESTIAQMMRCLQTILERVVDFPDEKISRIPLLSEPERRQIICSWNDTIRPYPYQQNLGSLFEQQVLRTPDHIALRFPHFGDVSQAGAMPGEEVVLSYLQLNERANQLANYLRSLGVGPNVLVAIYMERSLLMVVATLAVIKAGGAYLPLDLNYPVERLAFMLEDSHAPVLLTISPNLMSLNELDRLVPHVICLDRVQDQQSIAAYSTENSQNLASGEDLAYVMYTSGSTGKPKGVAIPQRAVSRLVINTNYIEIQEGDRIAHASNPSFDAATFEIWGALLNGAELVGVARETALAPKAYAAYLKSKKINILFLTTALFNLLAHETPDAFAGIKYLLFGGEEADSNSVRLVLAAGKPDHFLNVYGPTETTTFATWFEITDVAERASSVPIGKSLANSQIYILDPNLLPVPLGVPGELYLGGDGLAIEYINRPDMTAERFITNPFSEEIQEYYQEQHPELNRQMPLDLRLYKTGDRVRFVPGKRQDDQDRDIVFMGRFDFQIKLTRSTDRTRRN